MIHSLKCLFSKLFKLFFKTFKFLIISIAIFFVCLLTLYFTAVAYEKNQSKKQILAEFSDNPIIQHLSINLLKKFVINLSQEPLLTKAIYTYDPKTQETNIFSPSLRYSITHLKPLHIIKTQTQEPVYSINLPSFFKNLSIFEIYWDKSEQYFFLSAFSDLFEHPQVFVGKLNTNTFISLGY